MECRIAYIGTATFLIEIGGLRLLTDPVLDPAGSRETLRVRPLVWLEAGEPTPLEI